ncbi:helix-turn-helix domain-containing protein [Nocardia sp. NPDC050435]|uniref:PucR family transcriptional regulator n=1 Tax=Nocardia sp. NPDC050435 TaxID=3155040 RepID=UPI0033C06F7A
MTYERPSPRVQELVRKAAERVLEAPSQWFAEVDAATLAGHALRQIADDPVLAAGVRRSNRSNIMFWAAANLRAPGAPVPPNNAEVSLAVGRDLLQRGFEELTLDAYRAGESAATRIWVRLACSLTDDTTELAEMLEVSLRSISAFTDDTASSIAARLRAERAEMSLGSRAERRELVTMLLEGAPISHDRTEMRLGYALDRLHTAAIVWSTDPAADLRELDAAVETVAEAAREAAPLRVLASAACRWVWVHGEPDVDLLRAQLAHLASVRVAVGTTAQGVDGFRRSHLDALATQQLLSRLAPEQRMATFDEIELIALMTRDVEGADRFVNRVLGPLAAAPAEVIDTVRGFIAEQGNASRTAERLFTHRNTVLRRLQRADQLLPRKLADQPIEISVALQILYWRGR